MPRFVASLDLTGNQILNVRAQVLATDPGSPAAGQFWYNSSANVLRYFNGTTTIDIEGGAIEDVLGTAPIQVTGTTTKTVSILAATPSAAGSMSAADKAKLDAATAANTPGTIVMRDGSGNFSAGTITATLDGTAVNAANLGSQPGSHYLARANHTGTQLASTISDFDTQVRTNRLDQMAAPTAAVSANNQKITNLATPTLDSDAATKAYADSVAQGLDAKESVRLATTANMGLIGAGGAIDGVTVNVGDRVLVKNQTNASQNGIWIANAGSWNRALDADTSDKVTSGMFTFVEEGTVNADSGWVLSTPDPVTLGTTALTFVQFSGAGQITAGNGLTKTGNTLDVGGTANRITVGATAVDIAATYAGQASITTLGTITTGTWEATDVGVAHGGTGASTAAAARANLGATTKFAQNIGNGVDAGLTVTHNLNTRDVVVRVYETASPWREVFPGIQLSSVNTAALSFGAPVGVDQYRVVVVG